MSEETLPEGWAVATLADVATWASGGTPKSGTPRYYGGDTPWAIIGDLNDSTVFETAASITDEGLANSSAKVVPAGTLLVAMYGSIGKLGIAGVDMATNQAIATAGVVAGVSTKYLFWWMYGQRQDLLAAGKGGTQSNISQSVLKPWPIPLAPSNEQRRIVDELERRLSHVDAAERSLSIADHRLGLARRSVLSAVVDGSLIGVSSSSWSHVTAGDVTEVRGGIQKQPKRAPVRNKYPFLRVANVGRGTLTLDDVHEIELFNDELSSYKLRPGDLLVVEGNGSVGQIGRAAMWDGSIPDCVHQNHLIRVRPGELILPEFLALAWNAPSTIAQLAEVASSSSGLHTLSTSKVKAVKLSVPPLEVQRVLVDEADRRLSLLNAASRSVSSSSHRCLQLRHSLLAAAFSGHLVPQDLDDEPANVLLERIRAEREAAVPVKGVRKTTTRKAKTKKEPVA
jgi:type I restriction enzyme S subunit